MEGEDQAARQLQLPGGAAREDHDLKDVPQAEHEEQEADSADDEGHAVMVTRNVGEGKEGEKIGALKTQWSGR